MSIDEHNTKPAGTAVGATAAMGDVCPSKRKQLDLATVKDQLEETTGPEYWRSLEELAGSEEFQEMLHREFPKGASEWLDDFSRRGFLKTMGASLALAGLTGCTRMPITEIVPYVRQPENVVPGRPKYYATAFTLGGYASPILVESHLFRPTKIEGNPQHPASLGGTDIYAQASLLDLYDPDRAQNITYMGDVRSWNAFMDAIHGPMNAEKSMAGGGVRILTQTVTSPTLAAQIREYLGANPQAKWHVYEPINRDNVYEGAKLAFGEVVETRYDLSKADVIVSLDADFLYAGFPGSARYTRDFAARRNPDGNMNRLYVIESTPSSTGMKADHRLPMKAGEVEDFTRALAGGVGVNTEGFPGEKQKYVDAITKDLQSHKGSSVVIVGDHQPPAVHAFAHAINQAVGNVGRTVFYTEPVDANPVSRDEALHSLVEDMRAGKVDLLLILGGNPAYDAPAELEFASALKSSAVSLKVFLGSHRNETAELCQWHVPEAHYLESWSDARAYDGTVSIVQPLIEPLYGGKSAHELITILAGQSGVTGHDLVQGYWQKQHTGADFDAFWRKSLHDGWIDGMTLAPKQVILKTDYQVSSKHPEPKFYTLAVPQAIELNFRRDPSIYDGRFSNNGWLQELPKPLTKLTWDNPIMIGPAMAERLKLNFKDVAELEFNGKKVKGPVWIQAGHPDNSITVFLGYGRTRAGRVGTGAGFDVYPLRTSQAPWFADGAKLTPAGETYDLASTQGYQSMETPDGSERPLVQTRSLEEYKKEPNFAKEGEPPAELTLYKPPVDYSKEVYSWGMAIDLNACVGCNNCIVACQSENNIAVVGKEQTLKGRHMHWLRVDAYYNGPRENPKGFFQPVPCMQCENAPCELVCPVQATIHSSEGLNDMVYNRCVGTRYCSNNCPYKVRRFNFLLFQDWETPQFKLMRNPDVTVRSRGVMEKCTYCVQRISERRIDTETASVREGKEILIGEELQTACQQSCPANAIIFGNLNDPKSQVNQWKAQARNYSLLGELNTRPRTTYLAEVRNPNPELETRS
ncbi:MAG: TAT-variant-translocated molybdopterin oxidoreductase [Terriglobales bacterium]